MNYQETLDFLFSQLPMFHRVGSAAYRGDLNNTLILDEFYGHPHQNFKSIHVAGTNGKGSVSHILASILQEAGYKVGLYTSPHLKDFRERIKINGNKIPEKEVVNFIKIAKEVILEINPSFFELTVLMAFDYFSREKVDIAVIEVGLGGRLDSTNIITPMVSVITNISMDHTNLLGDTLEKIAWEKAGIIKKNVPVVIGETQTDIENVFLKKARQENAPIVFADQVYSSKYSMSVSQAKGSKSFKQSFNIYKNGDLEFDNLQIDLLGIYQRKNALTVLMAIDILNESGLIISKQAIFRGFADAASRTGLSGRWQIIGYNPLIICDTGHNEGGIAQVVEQLTHTPFKNLHFVIGVVKDKDVDKILQLLPKNAFYYFTKANIPRALDEKVLMEKALMFGLSGNCYSDVSQALVAAKNSAEVHDLIFVGGSTFIVAEAL